MKPSASPATNGAFEKALKDLETYAVLVGVSRSAEETLSHRRKVAAAQKALREIFYAPSETPRIVAPHVDGQNFYELCQQYRHAKEMMPHGVPNVVQAFNNLREYIKTGKLPWPSHEGLEDCEPYMREPYKSALSATSATPCSGPYTLPSTEEVERTMKDAARYRRLKDAAGRTWDKLAGDHITGQLDKAIDGLGDEE